MSTKKKIAKGDSHKETADTKAGELSQTGNPGEKLRKKEEQGGTLPSQADQKIRKMGQYPSDEEEEK